METSKTPIVDFSNLEVAFQKKSDSDLRETYQLFKLMNSAALVKTGNFFVKLAFALHLPIKWIIRKTIYKHFVGGTSIEDCKHTIEKLAEENVGSILDYALERETSEALFDHATNEVLRTIRYAHNHKTTPFSAFKITGVARFELLEKVSVGMPLSEDEKAEYQRAVERVDAIFKLGNELSVPVLIDAEESWIQPMLDDLVLDMMRRYNKEKAIVQNTYQMYRVDSMERLKKHHETAKAEGFKFGLKMVRGAYMEKERERAATMGYPSPIQPDKASTDKDFDAMIEYFVDNLDTINFMIASHNEKSLLLLAELMKKHNIPNNHPKIYFSQLYGMSDNLTFNLSKAGYNVAKYVPYGTVKTMMPYLLRRAQENTSVRGQSSRELQLIAQELKRRKGE